MRADGLEEMMAVDGFEEMKDVALIPSVQLLKIVLAFREFEAVAIPELARRIPATLLEQMLSLKNEDSEKFASLMTQLAEVDARGPLQ